ncbi:endonuclease III [candidate division TA06 bacterium]|uniref:Endonuclease III n=1 Tax=candidate division TA06 bacterium TaxID=2250710 RepID=A0A523XFE5_UNCT6|nr:MAG: endonuclease III [candidate division TA06 bacterium]
MTGNRKTRVKKPDPKLKNKVTRIIRVLSKEFPDAKTALKHRNPLEMLISTILSAQCTDAKVNEVTAVLFKKYKSPEDYAKANIMQLQKEIRQTGFFRNKAKNIKGASAAIIESFDSQVPRTMDEILTLPGVARKTANIVLQNAYGVIEGIAVDTHVRRLSQRLGLTKNKDPNKIEQDLMQITPGKDWARITDLLIWHGRKVCNAQRPKCAECVLAKLCPSALSF